MKEEIINREQEYQLDLSRFDTYEHEKRVAIEDMNRNTVAYIANIKNAITDLLNKESELEDAHSRRVVTIKGQIASAMSDYDDLLKAEPQLIDDAKNDDSIDLTAKTQEFKNKIDELEKAHTDMLDMLAKKRTELFDSITDEINMMAEGKADKLQSYENEITDIALTYEALLRDETNRQNRLNEEIIRNKEEHEKKIEDYNRQQLELADNFEERKLALEREFQESLNRNNSEFMAATQELKSEFDDLLGRRSTIIDALAGLKRKFDNVDERINISKANLKDDYNAKLMEIRKMLLDQENRKREKLSILDIMNDGIDEVFKKYN